MRTRVRNKNKINSQIKKPHLKRIPNKDKTDVIIHVYTQTSIPILVAARKSQKSRNFLVTRGTIRPTSWSDHTDL